MGAFQSVFVPQNNAYIAANISDDTVLSYYYDVASSAMGGAVVSTTDDFFGSAENVLNPKDPVPIPSSVNRDGTRDGWQPRRHVTSASTEIRLCSSCKLFGINLDTTNFFDAAPDKVTVEGMAADHAKWRILVDNASLEPNRRNLFILSDNMTRYSKIRVTTSSGGGLARIRCHGIVAPKLQPRDIKRTVNVASAQSGARITRWTDTRYGNSPNILLPQNDSCATGWETPLSREKDRNDYVCIKLSGLATLERIIIDTLHFKGNAPEAVSIDGCVSSEDDPYNDDEVQWMPLVENTSVVPNGKTTFRVKEDVAFSHLRLTVHPDGGIQQILAYGKPVEESQTDQPRSQSISISAKTGNSDTTTITIETEVTSDNTVPDSPRSSADEKSSQGSRRSGKRKHGQPSVRPEGSIAKRTRSRA